MYEHGGNIHRYSEPMIDFSANINPLGMPLSVREAISQRQDEVQSYPDPDYRVLKAAIRKNLLLPENEGVLVLGNGAVEIIHLVAECLTPSEVLIPAPAFSEYRKAAERAGHPWHEKVLYSSNGQLEVQELLKEIKKNTLLFLCNPNNPTGKALNRSDLESIYEKVCETESFLVLDETFLSFVEEEKQCSLLDLHPERALILRALTKLYGMPGVRLGYGVLWDQPLAERMKARTDPWHINTFADIAGQVALNDKSYLLRTKAWLKRERAYLMNALSEILWIQIYESDCNFLLIEALGITAEDVQYKLLKERILIRLPYGFTGLTESHFRIAVKDPISNRKLVRALRTIQNK